MKAGGRRTPIPTAHNCGVKSTENKQPERNSTMDLSVAANSDRDCRQRLFRVRCDRYVQYDGVSALPPEVVAFKRRSRGEDPPHIPLPSGPVVFRVGMDLAYSRQVYWDGEGPLPPPVMAYVQEHGALPRYGSEASLSPHHDSDSDGSKPLTRKAS